VLIQELLELFGIIWNYLELFEGMLPELGDVGTTPASLKPAPV
jgi:hypothetical protein